MSNDTDQPSRSNPKATMTHPSTNPPYDEKQIRCPKLGHQVSFGYCSVEDLGEPCSRCIGCWAEHFDVESHFRGVLSSECFESRFGQPPKPKVVTLVELIERAQRIAAKASGRDSTESESGTSKSSDQEAT
jgi:hypothetical protein